MKAVVGVLVMLLKVCHGVEINCDGRKDEAQCYGALGGTVVLRLMDNALEIFRFTWSNQSEKTILGITNNSVGINVLSNRSSFTPSNGTLTINNLTKSDEGNYTLVTFYDNGTKSDSRTLELIIQAPVSSVRLVPKCLSQGEMRVSCSSEGGDSPHYSWTLNGLTLTDDKLLSGNNTTNNITLKQDVSGQLACSVSNNVSSHSGEQSIETCGFKFIDCMLSNGTRISQWVLEDNETLCIKPPTTSSTIGKPTGIIVSNKPYTNITSSNPTSSITDAPWYKITAGVLSLLVILLVVGVCAHKKIKNNKGKEGKEEKDLMYADVTIMQLDGRQREQKAEMEVVYSQVKLPDQLGQTAEQTTADCVYAEVHKAR